MIVIGAYLAVTVMGAVAVRRMPRVARIQAWMVRRHSGGIWLPLIPGLLIRSVILCVYALYGVLLIASDAAHWLYARRAPSREEARP